MLILIAQTERASISACLFSFPFAGRAGEGSEGEPRGSKLNSSETGTRAASGSAGQQVRAHFEMLRFEDVILTCASSVIFLGFQSRQALFWLHLVYGILGEPVPFLNVKFSFCICVCVSLHAIKLLMSGLILLCTVL